MSKAVRKHKPVKVQCIQSTNRNLQIFFIVLAAVLAAIPFSLGKYLEFNTPGAYDSGAYVYSAKHILSGAKIGVEEIPSAQLGTLLVNMLGVSLFGFSDTGPKVVQMFMQAVALILMFIAMRKLFGTLPAAVGVIVTSVYLSAPLIAKFGNVKEQYMIACMVMGISCFVLYQLGGRWWLACLAGAFVSWAPLFKQTGTSVIGAMVLFVILQPVLKNRAWKQTGIDILLLLAGAAVAIGPLCVWIIAWDVQMSLPYSFVWETLAKFIPASGDGGQAQAAEDYITTSRKLVPFSEQWPRVLRYYALLILPIALAVGSIVARTFKIIFNRPRKSKADGKTSYDRFVLLFAMWWILDMAFVWISPRSYEQYYLPLNASAAMLGGYLIAVYHNKLKISMHKTFWRTIGLIGFLLMIIMSWHIFFGIEKSPHSGKSYGRKTRGYIQRLKQVSQHPKYAWEIVGEYIRTHSEPTDKIYVWGWFPGIYVKAQRFSSASTACCIPQVPPKQLEEIIAELLSEFEREIPKFIVDTRKRHIPIERPPHELWPIVIGAKETRPLSMDEKEIARYDSEWSKKLREHFGEDEALRYKAIKPLREFVMKNYRIVRPFGQHILFEQK